MSTIWFNNFSSRGYSSGRRQWRGRDVLAHPFKKRRPVGGHIVAAVVLAPGQFTADELPDGRHGVGEVVAGRAQAFLAEQLVHRRSEHACHEAPARVDPFRVTFFYDAVADEAGSRRA